MFMNLKKKKRKSSSQRKNRKLNNLVCKAWQYMSFKVIDKYTWTKVFDDLKEKSGSTSTELKHCL